MIHGVDEKRLRVPSFRGWHPEALLAFPLLAFPLGEDSETANLRLMLCR